MKPGPEEVVMYMKAYIRHELGIEHREKDNKEEAPPTSIQAD